MVTYKNLKSKEIRYSGRSSDFITPSFSYGCIAKCSYCYMHRHGKEGIEISQNVDQILGLIKNHDCSKVVKPNQTHKDFITWDIECNSDVSIDAAYMDWRKIFTYFRDSPRDFGTFATKFFNKDFLTFDPQRKMRIRTSLMPQKISSIVEKSTISIEKRIKSINELHRAGYDVHINFSPVIIYHNWISDYRELFNCIRDLVDEQVYKSLQLEVIFLTHNKKQHEKNLISNPEGEEYIWVPGIQETKESTYGGENIRYFHEYKSEMIEIFKNTIKEELNLPIRYIF